MSANFSFLSLEPEFMSLLPNIIFNCPIPSPSFMYDGLSTKNREDSQ